MNLDYYFMEDDDEEGYISIVNKNYWHNNHSISDQDIAKDLDLPKEFVESMESTFSYNGKENVKEVLVNLGFTELKDPYWWGDATTFYTPIKNNSTPRIDICCDDEEISGSVEYWLDTKLKQYDTLPNSWGKEFFVTKLDDFINKHNELIRNEKEKLTYIISSEHEWQDNWCCSVAIMRKKVFDSLPKEDEVLS